MTLSSPSGSAPSDPDPTAPTAPTADPASRAPVEPPLTVERSYQFWVVALVVGLLGAAATIVLALVARSALTSAVIRAGADPRAAESAVVVGIVSVAVAELLVTAIGLFVATRMRQGRNWARILLTVIGALGVLHLVSVVTGANHPVMTVPGAVHVLLVLVAVVYAYQPSSSAYFRAMKR